ncbi:hypothetical protein HDF18_01690 [Mucilaginibacter sp. X5P1]|uniref:hypothetical protein n=1 Tax=Mucilaginibacter sp. X5P1 TaxID=2723088 RepID=UPI00161CBF1B|nr:hypothetical protein [Mucilaginibacter sp. X5P1]MBB6138179.1 hypothetical protein [Mucilaginibacter sp. X5P1]
MTTIQLKSEIHKAIDSVPENVLPEILEYINSLQHQSPDKTKLNKFIDNVFEEDDELLRRLAE